MYPSKNTQSGSNYNITIYPDPPTINTPPTLIVSKYYFDNTLQAMLTQYSQIFDKNINN